MQTMVALDIPFSKNENATLYTLLEEIDQAGESSFSQLFNEQVQRLFNYGMNCCADRALIMNCLLEFFRFVRDRPKALRESKTLDCSLFKLFRAVLMGRIGVKYRSPVGGSPENLFPAGTVRMVQGLTSFQREAIFLRFNGKLSSDEVATVMNLSIEYVRGQISEAVEILSQQIGERMSA